MIWPAPLNAPRQLNAPVCVHMRPSAVHTGDATPPRSWLRKCVAVKCPFMFPIDQETAAAFRGTQQFFENFPEIRVDR